MKVVGKQFSLPGSTRQFFPDQPVKMVPIKQTRKGIFFLDGEQEGFFQEQLEDLGQEGEILEPGLPWEGPLPG